MSVLLFSHFSFEVANAIECFLKNCNETEFDVYSNDPLDDLLGSGLHASSLGELKLSYYTYLCGKDLCRRVLCEIKDYVHEGPTFVKCQQFISVGYNSYGNG